MKPTKMKSLFLLMFLMFDNYLFIFFIKHCDLFAVIFTSKLFLQHEFSYSYFSFDNKLFLTSVIFTSFKLTKIILFYKNDIYETL